MSTDMQHFDRGPGLESRCDWSCPLAIGEGIRDWGDWVVKINVGESVGTRPASTHEDMGPRGSPQARGNASTHRILRVVGVLGSKPQCSLSPAPICAPGAATHSHYGPNSEDQGRCAGAGQPAVPQDEEDSIPRGTQWPWC